MKSLPPPRNRIALEDTQLLSPDLTEQQAARIEQQAGKRANISALVDQIGVVPGQLGGRQHSLVDVRPGGTGGDDELLAGGDLGPPAGQEE